MQNKIPKIFIKSKQKYSTNFLINFSTNNDEFAVNFRKSYAEIPSNIQYFNLPLLPKIVYNKHSLFHSFGLRINYLSKPTLKTKIKRKFRSLALLFFVLPTRFDIQYFIRTYNWSHISQHRERLTRTLYRYHVLAANNESIFYVFFLSKLLHQMIMYLFLFCCC